MNIRHNRIPFGDEINLIQPGTGECDNCRAGRGKPHKYGCESEECPQCHHMIIGCSCDCLSSYDSSHIIQSLYKKFSSLEEALNDMASSHSEKSSYLDHAAVQFVFENVPKEVRNELVGEFRKKFPLLIPHIQDEEGRPYYTAEQLAKTLNVPLQEVQEKIDAMIEAGREISFFEDPQSGKVH